MNMNDSNVVHAIWISKKKNVSVKNNILKIVDWLHMAGFYWTLKTIYERKRKEI